jgi:hypothetical protein
VARAHGEQAVTHCRSGFPGEPVPPADCGCVPRGRPPLRLRCRSGRTLRPRPPCPCGHPARDEPRARRWQHSSGRLSDSAACSEHAACRRDSWTRAVTVPRYSSCWISGRARRHAHTPEPDGGGAQPVVWQYEDMHPKPRRTLSPPASAPPTAAPMGREVDRQARDRGARPRARSPGGLVAGAVVRTRPRD